MSPAGPARIRKEWPVAKLDIEPLTRDICNELDERVRAAKRFFAGEKSATCWPLSEVCTIQHGVSIAPDDKNVKQGVLLVARVAHIETPASLPGNVRKVASSQTSPLSPLTVCSFPSSSGYAVFWGRSHCCTPSDQRQLIFPALNE
jgi:hypothetical protein